MKLHSNPIIITAAVSVLCLAQSAFAAPPQQSVPEAGATLGLLAVALGGLGFLRYFLKSVAKK